MVDRGDRNALDTNALNTNAAVLANGHAEMIERHRGEIEGFFLLERERSDQSMATALVVFGSVADELPDECAARGVFVRYEPTRGWAIEVIVPPPLPVE